MKKIYFVRHALTQAIVDGIMAGSEFETVLTDEGRQEARQAGKFLKDKDIQLIVTSPMKRTRQTAQIIATETGIDETKIIENALVTERAFGSYSGRPFKDYINDTNSGRLDESQLESPEDLFRRVKEALKWLDDRPEDVILVVSHGATGRMFRLIDQKLAPHDFRTVRRFATAEIDEFTL